MGFGLGKRAGRGALKLLKCSARSVASVFRVMNAV